MTRLWVMVLVLALAACKTQSGASIYESDKFFKNLETSLSRTPAVAITDVANFPSDELCIIKESDAKYQAAFNSYLMHRDVAKLRKDQEKYDLAYLIFSFKLNGQIVRYFTKNGTYLTVNNLPYGFLDGNDVNTRYFERCIPSAGAIFVLNDQKTFIKTFVPEVAKILGPPEPIQ